MHLLLMGVSGCGKSTIGQEIANALELPFFDGDDFHPPVNIAKMSEGTPLTDEDRLPWLKRLSKLPQENPKGSVIACSALKKSYRDLLRQNTPLTTIYLHGTKETLQARLDERASSTSHFMPTTLLDSQLATLEDPTNEPNTHQINIAQAPTEILSQIISTIS